MGRDGIVCGLWHRQLLFILLCPSFFLNAFALLLSFLSSVSSSLDSSEDSLDDSSSSFAAGNAPQSLTSIAVASPPPPPMYGIRKSTRFLRRPPKQKDGGQAA